MPSTSSQARWRLALVAVVIATLSVLAQPILINPTLQDAFKFPSTQGELEYSYFVEHPPILSEDEVFLLVLSTFSVFVILYCHPCGTLVSLA